MEDFQKPNHLNHTIVTQVREERLKNRFALVLEDNDTKRQRLLTTLQNYVPARTDIMNAEERIANEDVLKSINHKLNYLRNPRNNPMTSTKLITKGLRSDEILIQRKNNQTSITEVMINNSDSLFVCDPSCVVFQEYKVGDVFTKTVAFRNVSAVSRMVRITPPKNKSIFTLSPIKYPPNCTSGMIATGMSATAIVTFTPKSLEDYQDYMLISSEIGSIKVLVIANREPPKLTLPSIIDIGYCLVGDAKRIVLPFSNHGGNSSFTIVSIEQSELGYEKNEKSNCIRMAPFTFYPIEFNLKRNESSSLTIEFVPLQIDKFSRTFIVNFDNHQSKQFTITGESRQIDISVGEVNGKSIDYHHPLTKRDIYFNDINVGSEQSQHIVVLNDTGIAVEYEWILVKNLVTAKQAVYNNDELFDIAQNVVHEQAFLRHVQGSENMLLERSPSPTTAIDNQIMALSHEPNEVNEYSNIDQIKSKEQELTQSNERAIDNGSMLLTQTLSSTAFPDNIITESGFKISPARGVLGGEGLETFTFTFHPNTAELIHLHAVLIVKSVPYASVPSSKQPLYLNSLLQDGHGIFPKLKSWFYDISIKNKVKKYKSSSTGAYSTHVHVVNLKMLQDMVSRYIQAVYSGDNEDSDYDFAVSLNNALDLFQARVTQVQTHVNLWKQHALEIDDDDLDNDEKSLDIETGSQISLQDEPINLHLFYIQEYNELAESEYEGTEVYPLKLISSSSSNNDIVNAVNGPSDDNERNFPIIDEERLSTSASLNSDQMSELQDKNKEVQSLTQSLDILKVQVEPFDPEIISALIWLDAENAINLLGNLLSQILDSQIEHEAVDFLREKALTNVAYLSTQVSGQGLPVEITLKQPHVFIPGDLFIGKPYDTTITLQNKSTTPTEVMFDVNHMIVYSYNLNNVLQLYNSNLNAVSARELIQETSQYGIGGGSLGSIALMRRNSSMNMNNQEKFNIQFNPPKILLLPESEAVVNVTLTITHDLGKYQLLVPIQSLDGITVIDTCKFTVNVICPVFRFDVAEIDTGLIGIGYTKSITLGFTNESDIPVKFAFSSVIDNEIENVAVGQMHSLSNLNSANVANIASSAVLPALTVGSLSRRNTGKSLRVGVLSNKVGSSSQSVTGRRNSGRRSSRISLRSNRSEESIRTASTATGMTSDLSYQIENPFTVISFDVSPPPEVNGKEILPSSSRSTRSKASRASKNSKATRNMRRLSTISRVSSISGVSRAETPILRSNSEVSPSGGLDGLSIYSQPDIVQPLQTSSVNIICKAGSHPQRIRGYVTCHLYDVNNNKELSTQVLSIRGEVQAPKAILYPIMIDLTTVYVGIPVKFEFTIENLCNLSTKYKIEFLSDKVDTLFKINVLNGSLRSQLEAKEVRVIQCEFIALNLGLIDEFVGVKVFGIKKPLGFQITAFSKGVSFECYESPTVNALANVNTLASPKYSVSNTITTLTASNINTQVTSMSNIADITSTSPKTPLYAINMGKYIKLYDRCSLKFIISNTAGIPLKFSIFIEKHYVYIPPVNPYIVDKNIDNSKALLDNNKLLLKPHDLDEANKFYSEQGRQYMMKQIQLREDKKYLQSGLGVSYQVVLPSDITISPSTNNQNISTISNNNKSLTNTIETNNTGVIPPFSEIVVEIRSFNDTPGRFDDNLEFRYFNEFNIEKSYFIPINMKIIGCPLVIDRNTLGMSYSIITPPSSSGQVIGNKNDNDVIPIERYMLSMGQGIMNSLPIIRSFIVRNNGATDGYVNWDYKNIFSSKTRNGPIKYKFKSISSQSNDDINTQYDEHHADIQGENILDSQRIYKDKFSYLNKSKRSIKSNISYWEDLEIQNIPIRIEPQYGVISGYGQSSFQAICYETNALGKYNVLATGKITFNEDSSLLSPISPNRRPQPPNEVKLEIHGEFAYPTVVFDKYTHMANNVETNISDDKSIKLSVDAPELFKKSNKFHESVKPKNKYNCSKSISILNPMETQLEMSFSTYGPFSLVLEQKFISSVDDIAASLTTMSVNMNNKTKKRSSTIDKDSNYPSKMRESVTIASNLLNEVSNAMILPPHVASAFRVIYKPDKQLHRSLTLDSSTSVDNTTVRVEEQGKLIVSFPTGQNLNIPLKTHVNTPFIVASSPKVSFGTCHVKKSCKGLILLSNTTNVKGSWSIEFVPDGGINTRYTDIRVKEYEHITLGNDDPSVFEVSPNEGEIAGPCISFVSAMAAQPHDILRRDDCIVPVRTTETSWATETLTLHDTLTQRHSNQHLYEADSFYPIPIHITFKPKSNIVYSSRLRFICEYGNVFDVLLQGNGTYEEHEHKPINPIPR